MEERINQVLDKLRPFLISEGGNIELIEYKDNIAYVKFTGHCAQCPMMDMTLNDCVKEALINEIEEIIDVKLI